LVVIVEDTAALAASLALALEADSNMETMIFGNARDALRFLAAAPRPIAALVTDLNLPDEDGFNLIRQVRGIKPYRELPAILITGQENANSDGSDILGRPNAVIIKPFSMKEVRRVLETLL
jgi:DNA-binding response OmpR family regulator